MATSDILGLFMSPEQYQAQQMAQQQAAEQQRAFNFAQLSPRDQAVYSTFLGAQQLGRGFGGLLGVQDPQLQRIRQRQEIMQSINPADMASLEQGILRASQTNDPELALMLANYRRDAASNIALTKQRETEKVPQDIQIAARIRQLTEDRLKLPENERGPIDAEIKRLERLSKPGATDKVEQLRDLYLAEEEAVRKAQAKAAPSQVTGLNGLPLATRAAVNVDDDPEVRAIRSLIRVATGDKEGKEIEVVAKATALADLVSADRKSPEWQAEYATQLRRLTADRETAEKRSPEAQLLIDAGFIPNSPAFISELDKLRLGGGKADDATRLEGYFNELATIKTKYGDDVKGFDSDSRVKALQTLINKISGAKVGGKQPDAIEIADSIAGLKKEIRDAKDPNAPEILQAKDKLAVLEQQLRKDKPNLTVVGEVRTGVDKGKTVYVDEVKDQQFVYSKNEKNEQVRKLVSDVDVDRMTSQVTASASTSNVGERTVVKGVAELDVEDLKTARANKRAASASNDSLRNLLALDDRGLIGGAFATNRVGVGNLLNTLGILSKADSNKLANSQEYQKIGADLIFNALQGKLGTGVSNKDVDFIREIFPQLETSATARRRLIKYLADKNNKMIDEADAAEAWIRKNKSFEGYKPLNSGVFHVPSTKLNLSNMSNAELDAAIKAKKAEKGK
jgi:hypothetical protein